MGPQNLLGFLATFSASHYIQLPHALQYGLFHNNRAWLPWAGGKTNSRPWSLGDQRLNARAVLQAERLVSKATESIPDSCLGWAVTQAAYRFLSNPRTDWQAPAAAPLGQQPGAHVRRCGSAQHPGHHGTRLQRPPDHGAGVFELRSPARDAPASHLCHQPSMPTVWARLQTLTTLPLINTHLTKQKSASKGAFLLFAYWRKRSPLS